MGQSSGGRTVRAAQVERIVESIRSETGTRLSLVRKDIEEATGKAIELAFGSYHAQVVYPFQEALSASEARIAFLEARVLELQTPWWEKLWKWIRPTPPVLAPGLAALIEEGA